jgi:hypothetical protein
MVFKVYTDFAYDSERYLMAYHFDRMWKDRYKPHNRTSLRQNIRAQRSEKNVCHKNYLS